MERERRSISPDDMDALARRFGAALRRFFQRRNLQRPDADDLVQEVFLRLINRGGVEDIENIEGYIFVTASNILRDRNRRRLSHREEHHGELEERDPDSSAFSPERVLQSKEALGHMLSALDELPKVTQSIFVLCIFDEYTHEEVAQDLNMSARNVRKHLAKAQKHLLARKREVG